MKLQYFILPLMGVAAAAQALANTDTMQSFHVVSRETLTMRELVDELHARMMFGNPALQSQQSSVFVRGDEPSPSTDNNQQADAPPSELDQTTPSTSIQNPSQGSGRKPRTRGSLSPTVLRHHGRKPVSNIPRLGLETF